MDPNFALYLVKSYINSWIDNDEEGILRVLHEDIKIFESHGSKHFGLKQVQKWISEWIRNGNIINKWNITSVNYSYGFPIIICEWEFEYVCNHISDKFKGNSYFEFKDNLITYINEYRKL